MSTGPNMQAASFVQSQVEHDASHSALFYLFQEVSKLTSPVHSSFLDTYPSTKQLNEMPRKDAFVVKKEVEDAHRFSPLLLCDQVKKVKEESPSSIVTTFIEPHCECNSPWKVLSLINLHCEKILHQEDVEEMESCSASSTIKSDHSTIKSSSAEQDETGVRNDSGGAECILKDASLSPVEDITECTDDSYVLHCRVKDNVMSCSVQLQPAEKTDTVRSELLEDNATASLQCQHRCNKEVKFSVNRQLKWKQEHMKDCCSTEQDILDVPLYKNSLLQTHIPNICLNTQLTSVSDDEACVALSKPALRLDHNANLTLFIEPPCDTVLPPPSSVLPSPRSGSLFSNTESFHSVLKQDDKTTSKPEGTHDPKEEKSPTVAQLQSSSCNVSSAASKPELWAVQKEEIGLPSSHQWRTKTPRKQPHPSRSADIQDPDFQGVTFRMDTELDDSREQCRLLITSQYSKELCKSVRKPRLKTRTLQKSLKISSSDEENDLTANVCKSKVCASCCTRKTPMWRDAEDGTPLCNACGIRYKKYRVRCVNCWHIPRKEGNSSSSCLKCGNFVRLTSAQRKHTT